MDFKGEYWDWILFEMRILKSSVNEWRIEVYFFFLYYLLNNILFIDVFLQTFNSSDDGIKFKEIFQKSHQLFFVKKFSKKLPKLLNILNKNHPAITID